MATATSIHAAHRNQIEIPPRPPSRRLLPRPAAASATYNSLRAAIKRHSRKLDTMKADSSSSSSGAGAFGSSQPAGSSSLRTKKMDEERRRPGRDPSSRRSGFRSGPAGTR
ncbi:Os08g0111000 [Oryza sativa Japonica Group]|uniref:Os08g0111000 protein n=1 Tax=Oryza sativa subsp. japonica TaxID=39947 RepID=A0A0N7KP59_ORYSJ|nr:Os08g0111000 [Oryza sativa Japonica Group]